MNNLCEILIVDSNPEYFDSFCKIMNSYSTYSIKKADSGISALNIINRCNPKFVIIEWDLPDMPGLELIERFKDKAKNLDIMTIMTCTQSVTPEHFKLSTGAGSLSLVMKPVEDITALADRIHQFLRKVDSPNNILNEMNQELTKKDLSLLQTHSFIENISKQISNIYNCIDNDDDTAKVLAEQLKKEIEEQQNLNKRNKYEISTNNIHPNFEKNLTQHSSILTGNDIRLCALIRLGLNSKDIASLLNVSPDSVKVSRSRLRKKLGLEKTQNLKGFLATF